MKIKLQELDKGPEEEPKDPAVTPDPEVPAPETQPDPEPEKTSEESNLRLEIAELRGKLSMITDKKQENPADVAEQNAINTKNRVMADAGTMDEDQFQSVYKMSKLQAVHSVNQFDLEQEKTKNSQRIAELEAKNELLAKYPNFAKHYEKVKSGLSDLSIEARRNPERLTKAMEKEFLFVSKEDKEPVLPAKELNMNRKRISNDFERPSITPNRTERKEDDLVAEQDRELAARFGINKESDRKKFSSPFIPMDFGVDPKDGKRVVFDGTRREPYKVANT